MAAAGVMNCSISAKSSEPPPTPVDVVSAEVKKIAPAMIPISIDVTGQAFVTRHSNVLRFVCSEIGSRCVLSVIKLTERHG